MKNNNFKQEILATAKKLFYDNGFSNTTIADIAKELNTSNGRINYYFNTKDEIGNPHDLKICCYVNNQIRQESNTKYMITSVEEAISELSQGMTLKAGTIIATGTPGGVAMGMKPPVYLKKGDLVRCEIENIGSLVNMCK